MREELDRIEDRLHCLREMLQDDREAAMQTLDTLLGEASELCDRAVGTDFEPAVRVMHDLLESLQRSVKVQRSLDECRDAVS